MKNSPSMVFLSAFLLVSAVGCTPAMQEAILRGASGAYYQRSQNPYVSPLGRASEAFAAGFFGTLADVQREQRLAQEYARQITALQQQEVPQQRHQQLAREQVIKARAEIEEFLKADRTALSTWTTSLPQWVQMLENYGVNKPGHPKLEYYQLSKKLNEDISLLDGRASFYLANLPAYIHENMDVEKVRTEIQDYLSKRQSIIEPMNKWNDFVNALEEAAKKEEERLRSIKAEEKTF